MIEIKEDFTGYPDGITPRAFKRGEQPSDLDQDYAALLVEKGHARPRASQKGKS